MDLYRNIDVVNNLHCASAGYTSGLCGEWTRDRFEQLAKVLDIDTCSMVVANQKHTDQIIVIEEKDAGTGVINDHTGDPFDAMITVTKGLTLCVHTADCVPVVFLDPVKKAAGIAHSGWVGTSLGIAGKTVRLMSESFGCDPDDIICFTGPYNHACCYEVGEDVCDAFRKTFTDTECGLFFKRKDTMQKYMLDMGAAISLSLRHEGVPGENIYDSGHCTFHTTDFSSWRRTKNKKHQILTFITLI